jgi:hypothetical protein
MTMLDEDLLRSALHDLADQFDVPEGATRRILAEQRDLTRAASARPGIVEAHPRVARLTAWPGHHRVVSVAALVVLLLAGLTTAGIVAGGGTSPVASGPTNPSHPARAPSVGHGSSTPFAVKPATSSPTAAPGLAAPPAGGRAQGGVKSGAGAPVSSPLPPVPGPVPTVPPPLPPGAVGRPARIQQTGTLDLSVPGGRVSATITRLTNLATANGGFVVSVQEQAGTGSLPPGGTLTIQVPVGSFESVVAQAQRLGHVVSLATRATDVTGQYVDLQARIDALESSRQQYLTILSKATSIGDILAVQSQLDRLQSELEQLQSQLQVLDSQTTYSTLVVSVDQRTLPPGPGRPGSGLARAWHDAVHGFVVGAEGLLRAAGPALFVLLCLAAAVVLARLGWRAWQRRRI